jgi:hypothetical protein
MRSSTSVLLQCIGCLLTLATLASDVSAQWTSGVASQKVNGETSVSYHDDGDVLTVSYLRGYFNNTEITQFP